MPRPPTARAAASADADADTDTDADADIDAVIAKRLRRAASSPCICTLGVQGGPPSLEAALASIDELAHELQPACLKVGITEGPYFRFHHQLEWPSYERLGYTHMRVLHAGTVAEAVWLETSLISALRGRQGLQNDRPGGEGSSSMIDPCFTYVVGVCAADRGLMGPCKRRRCT